MGFCHDFWLALGCIIVPPLAILFEFDQSTTVSKTNAMAMRTGSHQWITILENWYKEGRNACIDIVFEKNAINTNSQWFGNLVTQFKSILDLNCIVDSGIQNSDAAPTRIALHCWISNDIKDCKLSLNKV